MLVRGIGITDISVIENISIKKVLSVLVNSNRIITPKQQHYNNLEVDEFWTYVGKKKNKVWLIYAYHSATGEIVGYVWGKRNLKTVKKMRDKLISMGISYDTICTDNWDSFIAVFKDDNHVIGKDNTRGIEGNNCRLRHKN
jgi:IS1 family transposase